MRPLKFGIGQPHVRIEHPALLTGRAAGPEQPAQR